LPDGRHFGLGIGRFADRLQGLAGILAPEVSGVPNLHAIVGDPQVNRRQRLPLDDHGVVAAALEHGAESAGAVRFSPAAGDRRFGEESVARAAGDGRIGERAGCRHQFVLRTQGVNAGGQLVPQNLGRQSPPADEFAGCFLAKWFCGDVAGCQIDPQNLPCISVHDGSTSHSVLKTAVSCQ